MCQNENKKIAEILVEQGYAKSLTDIAGVVIVDYGEFRFYPESVDPFYSGDNTHKECIARRQFDFIEDWIMINHYLLYQESSIQIEYPITPYSKHGAFWYQNRRNRVEWCIQELIK